MQQAHLLPFTTSCRGKGIQWYRAKRNWRFPSTRRNGTGFAPILSGRDHSCRRQSRSGRCGVAGCGRRHRENRRLDQRRHDRQADRIPDPRLGRQSAQEVCHADRQPLCPYSGKDTHIPLTLVNMTKAKKGRPRHGTAPLLFAVVTNDQISFIACSAYWRMTDGTMPGINEPATEMSRERAMGAVTWIHSKSSVGSFMYM